jgi:anti-sigma factor RsiW
MTDSFHYSSEELTAYLDDEVSPDVRRRIGSALDVNANLRIQLESLTLDRATLKTAFEGLLQFAPSYRVTHVTPITPIKLMPVPTDNRVKFAVVAALCAMIGWVAATGLFPTTPTTWQQKAAVYHSLYVNGTINSVFVDTANMEVELERVTTALGKPIFLESLRRIPEFEYKRAQILGFEGRPLMQIAFLSRLGAPVVLCIMRSDTSSTKGVESDVMQGMAAATWSRGPYEYLLIGGSDKDLIARAANTFAATL